MSNLRGDGDTTTKEMCKCGHSLDDHVLNSYCTKCNCGTYTFSHRTEVPRVKVEEERAKRNRGLRGRSW